MRSLVAAVLALVCGCAHAQWTTEQKAMSGAFLTLWAADYGQTRTIAQHPERWVEYNPVIGKHPTLGRVNLYFLAAPIISGVLLDNVSSTERTWALRVLTSLEVGLVAHNAHIGIRASF